MTTTKPKPFVDDNGKPIVFVELRREGKAWKPCTVVSQSDKSCSNYDFDWCNVPGLLCYHESGCGPAESKLTLYPFVEPEAMPGRIWCDESIKLVDESGNELDADRIKALGYERLTRRPSNPFEDADSCDSTEYCEVCDSRFPTDGLCEHVVWSNEDGGYAGCGHSETDIGDTQKSIFRLLQVLPPKFVDVAIEAMREGTFSFGLHYGDYACRVPDRYTINQDRLFAEHNGERRYGPAFDWLQSLDDDSVLPNALTLGWFWQFQRERWRNRCVIGNLTFIRKMDDGELDKWLALDPHQNVLPTYDVPRKFKAGSANDLQFLANPSGTSEVILWTKGKNKHDRSLRLSVAEVRVGKKSVEIVFGRILERGYKHVSEIEGYELCRFGY